MASGYSPDPFIWAFDAAAKRSGPVHRDLVALDPDRYRTDAKHPVVDDRGVLLPSKPAEDPSKASTTNTTTTTNQANPKAKED